MPAYPGIPKGQLLVGTTYYTCSALECLLGGSQASGFLSFVLPNIDGQYNYTFSYGTPGTLYISQGTYPAVPVFGGWIERRGIVIDQDLQEYLTIEARDWAQAPLSKIFHGTYYKNEDCGTVFLKVINDMGEGLGTSEIFNLNTGYQLSRDSEDFPDEKCWDLLKDCAEFSGHDWYLRPSKQFEFFQRGSRAIGTESRYGGTINMETMSPPVTYIENWFDGTNSAQRVIVTIGKQDRTLPEKDLWAWTVSKQSWAVLSGSATLYDAADAPASISPSYVIDDQNGCGVALACSGQSVLEIRDQFTLGLDLRKINALHFKWRDAQSSTGVVHLVALYTDSANYYWREFAPGGTTTWLTYTFNTPKICPDGAEGTLHGWSKAGTPVGTNINYLVWWLYDTAFSGTFCWSKTYFDRDIRETVEDLGPSPTKEALIVDRVLDHWWTAQLRGSAELRSRSRPGTTVQLVIEPGDEALKPGYTIVVNAPRAGLNNVTLRIGEVRHTLRNNRFWTALSLSGTNEYAPPLLENQRINQVMAMEGVQDKLDTLGRGVSYYNRAVPY
jgi:hypothetical protein